MRFDLWLGDHRVGWSLGGAYIVVIKKGYEGSWSISRVLSGDRAKVCWQLLLDSGLLEGSAQTTLDFVEHLP